jgi:hypothetical protein
MLYDHLMNVDDYFVVIVNVNQFCFRYLYMISLGCKPHHINQLKVANNMLNNI